MVAKDSLKTLSIDLNGLDVEDIEVFLQEGKGMPDFAASTGKNCIEAGSSSCHVDNDV